MPVSLARRVARPAELVYTVVSVRHRHLFRVTLPSGEEWVISEWEARDLVEELRTTAWLLPEDVQFTEGKQPRDLLRQREVKCIEGFIKRYRARAGFM